MQFSLDLEVRFYNIFCGLHVVREGALFPAGDEELAKKLGRFLPPRHAGEDQHSGFLILCKSIVLVVIAVMHDKSLSQGKSALRI